MTPAQRSRCMARIRSKNTGPELTLRKELWRLGLRYRLHHNVFGKPDLVFMSARVAVFVDGCFWHGCPSHSSIPKTNPFFWKKKISQNIHRDKKVNERLSSEGWTVLRFWEHEIKRNIEQVICKVVDTLRINAQK